MDRSQALCSVIGRTFQTYWAHILRMVHRHNVISRPSFRGVTSTSRAYSELEKHPSGPGAVVADASTPNASLRDSKQATWTSPYGTSLWTRLESFVIADSEAWGPDGAVSLVARGRSQRHSRTAEGAPAGVAGPAPPREAKNPPLPPSSRFLASGWALGRSRPGPTAKHLSAI